MLVCRSIEKVLGICVSVLLLLFVSLYLTLGNRVSVHLSALLAGEYVCVFYFLYQCMSVCESVSSNVCICVSVYLCISMSVYNRVCVWVCSVSVCGTSVYKFVFQCMSESLCLYVFRGQSVLVCLSVYGYLDVYVVLCFGVWIHVWVCHCEMVYMECANLGWCLFLEAPVCMGLGGL